MIFKLSLRDPDFTIYQQGIPYLLRWYVIPKNRFLNIYLHKFISSDDGILHDHPWPSMGIILKGEYIEHVPKPCRSGLGYNIDWYTSRKTVEIIRKPWRPVLRSAEHIHRVELYTEEVHHTATVKPVWTIFITGPRIREWGFWCKDGFKHFASYIRARDGGNDVGSGCGD